MIPFKKTSLPRLFFVLLALLALGLAQRPVFGQRGGVYTVYTLEAADVQLSGAGEITSYNYLGGGPAPRHIVIPDELGGQAITGIGPNAFADNRLISVDLPEGITSIGESAFANNRLTSLDLSEGNHLHWGWGLSV